MIHTAVLKKEVLEYLDPKQNENFVDCTVGEGGHSEDILNSTGPNGKVLGIDLDPQQIVYSHWLEAIYKDRVVLTNDSYTNLKEIIERKNFGPVSGILLDLGMSSAQLEGTHKGFSFQVDQGLDMRYNDLTGYLTAEKIVNEYPEEKIEEILRDYGEEKFSKKIAKNIVEQRKQGRIKTTFQLIEIIKDATPSVYWRGKIHYATRTFQALRIAVNDELENIKRVLPQALSVLQPQGRLVVISFHSLEDRIVKDFFKKNKLFKILTKKPVTAGRDELGKNPRSRSAKLRAVIKI
ncbi:MAG: 16S rRNA (cytosine(1402)-N(4))-methyltransferase [Candidatus Staskawiczbacteria bacterium RIFOXYD2_FULL_37_9]|uniref:Ribosomal RNA small subunit methyltransferase H n=1 Tax=Candidatus Staskawiczbacteria bacterium RIFOXYB1_FULL_37_44 TaxID=1802223 RepID=A0A1G2IWQ2_9BACT|nr:MAG: 16S rRNA (cytosine(1402)-N(4))-methyltransferase [Candidatus Staskawiczbacteria bacterium RIFOXYB1_FULL_37_44]OGZ83808.1 MAG: 16S rRNA (cytosine(1402)-N(4))-methyltransferase [Candidatus Staskawiczbacteria bacterium RIFOXYC1_FULL_37_52]OGZ88957.1 MAG: 16S rRNA (cytosine(1402)-N(4))-methyltransferase [Candidatus Staskawiczbacteria bacterium RIFOXYD1_FULL_37_110]OGZ89599.1 MAG: 16S rRNA (cytosine(1402)-N(4))-methyltransferase [Candidatus Staskawiczbacteria bacterium RIFOXYC2_FULL_37_19]OG